MRVFVPAGPFERDRYPTWIQEFRCVADVGKGTELTHAYVDASDWSNHRRAELLDRYGFVCDCPRCPTNAAGEPVNSPPTCPLPYSKSGVAPPLTPEMTRKDRDAQMARVVWCQEACWAQVALEHDKTRARHGENRGGPDRGG